jgi:hypothetical protein
VHPHVLLAELVGAVLDADAGLAPAGGLLADGANAVLLGGDLGCCYGCWEWGHMRGGEDGRAQRGCVWEELGLWWWGL